MLVLVVVIRAGYVGSLRGVWVEVLRWVSVAGALAAAANGTEWLLAQLLRVVPWGPDAVRPWLFYSVVALALGALTVVVRWLRRGVKQNASALLNQVVSAVLGGATGLLIAGMTVWALHSVPNEYLRASVAERSLTGAPLVRGMREAVRMTAKPTGGVPSTAFYGGRL